MSDMHIINHFLFALLATFGWAVYFNVPKKDVAPCAVIGAIGWTTYVALNKCTQNEILSNFTAALVVTFLSEASARIYKNPGILYIIPGIIPLVPGLSIYNTMLGLIQSNYVIAVETATKVILMSGSIVMGILVASSIVRISNQKKLAKTSR